MDATAIDIAVGLLATAAYSVVRLLRQQSFDLATVLLVFLSGFSVPGGANLIWAALSGDPRSLPASWREYVAVAGVAAIGLAFQFLMRSFRSAWPKRATVTPTEVQTDVSEVNQPVTNSIQLSAAGRQSPRSPASENGD